jgi:hypothetical protein
MGISRAVEAQVLTQRHGSNKRSSATKDLWLIPPNLGPAAASFKNLLARSMHNRQIFSSVDARVGRPIKPRSYNFPTLS